MSKDKIRLSRGRLHVLSLKNGFPLHLLEETRTSRPVPQTELTQIIAREKEWRKNPKGFKITGGFILSFSPHCHRA